MCIELDFEYTTRYVFNHLTLGCGFFVAGTKTKTMELSRRHFRQTTRLYCCCLGTNPTVNRCISTSSYYPPLDNLFIV